MTSRVWYYLSMIVLGTVYITYMGLSLATVVLGVVLWIAHARFWWFLLN